MRSGAHWARQVSRHHLGSATLQDALAAPESPPSLLPPPSTLTSKTKTKVKAAITAVPTSEPTLARSQHAQWSLAPAAAPSVSATSQEPEFPAPDPCPEPTSRLL